MVRTATGFSQASDTSRLGFAAASCLWRIEYEGAFYHVSSRGNNQQDIFVTDEDRHLFLDTLGQMSERFDIDIFVYVLMDNHYHILLRTAKANLSKSMQWSGTTYTRRFNLEPFKKYGSVAAFG